MWGYVGGTYSFQLATDGVCVCVCVCEAISGGVSWDDAVRPLRDVSPLALALVIFYAPWQLEGGTHQLHPEHFTCLVKRDYFNRKYIFQPLIFKGTFVNFQGSNGKFWWFGWVHSKDP